MKNKLFFCLLFGLLLNIPSICYSQCASIYEKGVEYMTKGQYKTAIKYFNNAKVCDESLAPKCDEKIKECQSRVGRKKKNVEVSTSKKLITIDKTKLEFGPESTNAQTVKVASVAEWTCVSAEEWCKVEVLEGKMAVTCDINPKAEVRTALLELKNGSDVQKVEVVQAGVEPKIEFTINKLEINKKGDVIVLGLICNTSYEIVEKPDWVIVKNQNPDNLIIEVEKYDNGREGVLTVAAPNGKTASVIIEQKMSGKKKVMKFLKL